MHTAKQAGVESRKLSSSVTAGTGSVIGTAGYGITIVYI
jgi:hypothetical protein